jgi:hypothetical protein
MRYLSILIFALLPLSVAAQDTVARKRLTLKDCYEYAVREYIIEHPTAGYSIPRTGGRAIFLKKQDHLSGMKDTLAGVRVKLIDPSKDMDTLSRYFPKKQKFILLDVEKLTGRAAENYIWILPLKTSFNPRKNKMEEPKYGDWSCKYTYEFTPQLDQYFLYKDAVCKELK